MTDSPLSIHPDLSPELAAAVKRQGDVAHSMAGGSPRSTHAAYIAQPADAEVKPINVIALHLNEPVESLNALLDHVTENEVTGLMMCHPAETYQMLRVTLREVFVLGYFLAQEHAKAGKS